MNEKIAAALDQVRDEHIAEAAQVKKKRRTWIIRIAATAAVLAILIGVIFNPPITATAVSLPDEQRSKGSYQVVKEARQALSDFFVQGSSTFLDGEENSLWSPVNAFIGLAMVAELTEGESRQQILDLFGISDLATLRTYVTNIWEQVNEEGNEVCTLANSLWLSKDLSYIQDSMDNLSYYYYASVYKGKMGSATMNNAIASWLNQNTGGLLKSAADQTELTEDTILALYSTIYLRGTWTNEFSKSRNTTDTFHSYSGDRTVTYMNKTQSSMTYYWGENFGAVSMYLKNGCTMWFILPDEGVTTTDVLADGAYMEMITGTWENRDGYLVNLSVPKFDISYGIDLKEGLQEMGVTDIFSMFDSDFSAITGDSPVCVTAVNQNSRVIIDEEGVKAATYIEIPSAGAAEPPTEIVDFVLDRPFLFVISSSSVPLFVGTVTEP